VSFKLFIQLTSVTIYNKNTKVNTFYTNSQNNYENNGTSGTSNAYYMV
jgi:hypothetical protein